MAQGRSQLAPLLAMLDYIGSRMFHNLAVYMVRVFELDRVIREAGMLVSPVKYAERLLALTFVSVVVSAGLAVAVVVLDVNILAKLGMAVSAALLPIGVLAGGLMYPVYVRDERKRGLNTELHFLAAYMTTLMRAGAPLSSVVEKLANLRILKAVRKEARLIYRDMKLFGMDPLSAIERNALYNPNIAYRDFMLGYVVNIRTGGDVLHYLEIKTQDIFNSKISEMRVTAERLIAVMELYIVVMVILAMILYVFLVISGIFPAGVVAALGGEKGIMLFSMVVMPIISLIIIYLVHSIQPKDPISFQAPYRLLSMVGVPLAIVSAPFIIAYFRVHETLLGLTPLTYESIMNAVTGITVFLLLLSLPTAVYSVVEAYKLRNLGDALAAFFRDLTEVSKSGLTLEKSLQSLAKRSYGPLDPIIKRLASSIALGLDINRALRVAVRGYRSWLLLASMKLLIDTIEAGGTSPEVLESIARYTWNLTEVERELRTRLKPYILMPYAGAILIAVAGILVLSYTTELLPATGQEIRVGGIGLKPQMSPEVISRLAMLLSVGSVLNAWLMGMVAGKISTGKLYNGFLHAAILTAVTALAVSQALKTVPTLAAQ